VNGPTDRPGVVAGAAARGARARRGRRRGALGALLALPLATLAGCLGFEVNSAPRFQFFVLEDLDANAAPLPVASPADRVLLLSMGQSQALYDSDRMVFSPDGISRAFFQFANWSERPARRLVALLERRLERSGAFRSVALSTAGVRGDLLLSVRLDELYVDDAPRPPVVRVAVLAEMVDWRTRTMLSRRGFVQEVHAATADAQGAAQASSLAMTRLLHELTAWAAETANAAPAHPRRDATAR
jgi:cholesterol transport system auxiliary component